MFQKIKKMILRAMIPDAESIADLAVEAVAQAVNTSSKTDAIAKYASIADQFTTLQALAARILVDGKIDESEKAELKKLALPIAEKIVNGMKEALA